MNSTSKNRVVFAVAIVGLLCAAMASAQYPASVAGTWSIVGNRHAGTVVLTQGTVAGQCQPITGTIYPELPQKGPVIGYYCPATGRIAFFRKNAAGVAHQVWIGNVSYTGEPQRMGGTFHALDPASGSGTLGEVHFEGRK
ncbi:MAG TPA: hypothetical protein VE685_01460 [Thermoanaerobaculia bacterium]|nr:hypothetical protein [Thermoanaerobaculia bacterium]